MIKELQIEPTVRCNLNCIMCNRNNLNSINNDLDLSQFKKLLNKFPDLERIHLHGLGEPLLNPDLIQMIRFAKKKNICVVFNTNAHLLTKSNSNNLVKAGVDEIRISFDAGTHETYKKVRRSDFTKVLENAKNIVDAAKDSKTKITAFFVLLQQNVNEIPDLLKILKKLSIKKLIVQNELNWGSNSKTKLVQANLEKEFKKVRKIASKNMIEISLPSLKPKKGNNCIWPFNSCYIAVDGSVTPCCALSNPKDYTMGNIYESSFDKIWTSDQYNDFRIKIVSDSPPKCCVNCPVYNGTFKDYTSANNSQEENINNDVELLKANLLEKLKGNLLLVVLFGSANKSSELDTLSDLDLFIVVKEITHSILEQLTEIRDKCSINREVDIKVFSKKEWDKSHLVPIQLLHDWTKRMMINNKNKILFANPNIKIKLSRNKQEFVFAIEYFFDKIKRYFMSEKVCLRGKIEKPNDESFFKITYSALFCIAKFSLAMNNKFVFSNQEIINNINDENIKSVLVEMQSARKNKNWDYELLSKAFYSAKNIYESVLVRK